PSRIRDFIIEHHGTTMVSYFYNQALAQTDDEDSIDIEQFTYPGPKPQSREAAIMMIADSCESTVRARKPANRQEIAEIVDQIIENRMRDGQLDESDLTLKDVETARSIFIEMLQAVFHPRINYPTPPPSPRLRTQEIPAEVATQVKSDVLTPAAPAASEVEAPLATEAAPPKPTTRTQDRPVIVVQEEDDSPLPEVPPLRRNKGNGAENSVEDKQD